MKPVTRSGAPIVPHEDVRAKRSEQTATLATTFLFVIYLGLTRLAWWTYIGSDVWGPHLRGRNWSTGELPWVAAFGVVVAALRAVSFRPWQRRLADCLVLFIAVVLALVAAFGGRAEVMYGSYDRMLAAGWAALVVAVGAALVALASLRANRQPS